MDSLPEDLPEDCDGECPSSSIGASASGADAERMRDVDRELDCGVDGDGSCDAERDCWTLERRMSTCDEGGGMRNDKGCVDRACDVGGHEKRYGERWEDGYMFD